jgi:hypothetical protein
MSTSWNGTGPVSRYYLNFLHLFVVFFLFLYKLSEQQQPDDVIILIVFNNIMIYFTTFRIKI